MNLEKKHLINNQIKANKILLLDKDGEKLGDYDFQNAIKLANDQSLDLVQVGLNQKDNIAICKIFNYETFIYYENKQKAKQDFQNRKSDIKSITLAHGIGLKDYQIKMKKIKEFLDEGRKVKVGVKFGSFREFNNKDVTEPFIERIMGDLSNISAMDGTLTRSGSNEYACMVKPRKVSIKNDSVEEGVERKQKVKI